MRVVPTFDELEHRPARFVARTKGIAIQQFALQCGKEALTQGVVIAIPGRAHGRPHPGLSAPLPEGQRGVLAALVGVVDHPRWMPLPDGHLQGGEYQFRAQVSGHGPPNHPAAPGIDHHSQIQEPGPGRDIGDVSHPELIWPRSSEIAGDQIRGWVRRRCAPGCPPRTCAD